MVLALAAFMKVPKSFIVIKPFDLQKSLRKWHEIARLNYKWERHLDNVTATYSLKENGDVRVDNKGYGFIKGE